MKITTKSTQPEYKKPAPKTNQKVEIDRDATIPYGKYADKKLSWVINNDAKYYQWMLDNNIIVTWELTKKDQEEEPDIMQKPTYDKLYTTSGIWMELREHNEPTKPSIWI